MTSERQIIKITWQRGEIGEKRRYNGRRWKGLKRGEKEAIMIITTGTKGGRRGDKKTMEQKVKEGEWERERGLVRMWGGRGWWLVASEVCVREREWKSERCQSHCSLCSFTVSLRQMKHWNWHFPPPPWNNTHMHRPTHALDRHKQTHAGSYKHVQRRLHKHWTTPCMFLSEDTHICNGWKCCRLRSSTQV